MPIIARVDELPALQLRPLADQREAQLWREYVDRYHYLGYTPLPGAQMRYLVTSQRRVLAVVGFGASAWKAAPRDRFIGWSVAQREARLQLVVNNARFLILPWVQVRNLASTVLARSRRRLPDDWQARYRHVAPSSCQRHRDAPSASLSILRRSVHLARRATVMRSDRKERYEEGGLCRYMRLALLRSRLAPSR